MAAVVGLVSSLGAAPPPNDNCAGAEIIPAAGPFPYYTAVTDVIDATATNEPSPSCAPVSVLRSVWYRFTPNSTRLYTISCSEDTATTVQDTVMAIYTSSSGCGGSFTEVDCNDDSGYLQSAISRTLTANVTYYIVVWMASTSPAFLGTSVQLRVSQPATPANDTCAGAELIPGGGPFPYLTSIADTTLATTTGEPPAPTCTNAFVRSVWYRFAPDATGTYEISTCTNTATTVYDTLLGVYTTSSGCGTFTHVACNNSSTCGGNNNFDPNQRAVLTLTLTNGVTYYIVAWEGGSDAYTPGETSMQLRLARFLAPTVATWPASSITSTSAVVNASVNPENLPTTAWFQWGVTTNYGSTTATQNLGNGMTNLNLSATLTGLSPATSYHFRARVTNSLGAAFGADRSFAWSATRPNVTSFARSNGEFALRFAGQAGQLYFILASTDLLTWTGLGPASDLGNGVFEFMDTNRFAARYYRTLAP